MLQEELDEERSLIDVDVSRFWFWLSKNQFYLNDFEKKKFLRPTQFLLSGPPKIIGPQVALGPQVADPCVKSYRTIQNKLNRLKCTAVMA